MDYMIYNKDGEHKIVNQSLYETEIKSGNWFTNPLCKECSYSKMLKGVQTQKIEPKKPPVAKTIKAATVVKAVKADEHK